jgi:hypothetical protein
LLEKVIYRQPCKPACRNLITVEKWVTPVIDNAWGGEENIAAA